MKTKRQIIENFVNEHKTLSKVADFISTKHNVDRDIIYNKLIDFLTSESNYIQDNMMKGIRCFKYDVANNTFVNKTIYSNFNDY